MHIGEVIISQNSDEDQGKEIKYDQLGLRKRGNYQEMGNVLWSAQLDRDGHQEARA